MQKIYFIIFGAVLGAALCFGTVYIAIIQPSEVAIRDYKAKQSELITANTELGKSVSDREADIIRLEKLTNSLRSEADRTRESYSRLEEANRVRQNIIITARKSVEGSSEAIRKLELIIDAFEKVEQSLNN